MTHLIACARSRCSAACGDGLGGSSAFLVWPNTGKKGKKHREEEEEEGDEVHSQPACAQRDGAQPAPAVQSHKAQSHVPNPRLGACSPWDRRRWVKHK